MAQSVVNKSQLLNVAADLAKGLCIFKGLLKIEPAIFVLGRIGYTLHDYARRLQDSSRSLSDAEVDLYPSLSFAQISLPGASVRSAVP